LKRGAFIAFLGPVGVGKTTIIKHLAWRLRQRGLNTLTISIKSYHGLSYVLWFFVARAVKAPKNFAPWYSIPTILGLKRVAKVLAILSAYLEVLIHIPLKLIVVILLRRFGFIIISEEYLSATLLDYFLSWRDLGAPIRAPLKILCSFSAKVRPDIVIFLDANMEAITRRWFIRGYGDPQIRYVISQKKLLPYLLEVFNYNYVIIDSSALDVRKTVRSVEVVSWKVLLGS
jgi:thymidylate kinase